MIYNFTALLNDILVLADIIYNKFTSVIQYLFMPLSDFLNYVNTDASYIDIPDWFITLVSSAFGDTSLIFLMFGGAFALTILLSFVKWVLDIVLT